MYENEDELDLELDENLAFARKYRPISFEGYVGNLDIKDTLFRYLKQRKRPQSMLITGNTGCGKTTLSRIIEREYRCLDRDPEKGACGVCMSCQMFNEYIKTGVSDNLADVYEIDASDKSGKKDIDAMLESMEYPALSGDWKVYLLDEAHLLSEGAMGRLLKTLEEPPEGVLILISTTDPDRLLGTIKNRCQLKLAIEKPKTNELINHLKYVCDREGKKYDIQGLRMISGRADNVIRDALNDVETVINTRGDATAISVSEQWHQVNESIIYDFYKSYLEDDYVGYLGVIYRIKTEFNFSQFLTSLVNFTTRGIYILNNIDVDGLTKEEISNMSDLFSKFSVKEISRVLSELRKMSKGNIEANLMSFIYCKEDYTGEKTVVSVPDTDAPTKEETGFRNDNLKRIQDSLLQKGKEEAVNQSSNATFKDISSLFNLEKVDN